MTMANIEIYIMLAKTVSDMLAFQILDFQKVGHGRREQFSQLSFDGKYQNLQMSYHAILC